MERVSESSDWIEHNTKHFPEQLKLFAVKFRQTGEQLLNHLPAFAQAVILRFVFFLFLHLQQVFQG